MAYDIELSESLARLISSQPGMEPRKMFGGVAWLLNGNMCVGVHEDKLIIRVGVTATERILKEPHVGPMDFTGRPMKGWAMVSKSGLVKAKDLARFVQMAVDFVSELPSKSR